MEYIYINGVKNPISYKTHSGMYSRYRSPLSKRIGNYGVDIYTVDNEPDYIILVGTTDKGSELRATAKAITRKRYAEIVELFDPYKDIVFHNALMKEVGFY